MVPVVEADPLSDVPLVELPEPLLLLPDVEPEPLVPLPDVPEVELEPLVDPDVEVSSVPP